MKDSIEGENITSKIYGNENENKMNICNESEYSLGKDNSFNYKKCIVTNDHLDNTLSTDSSTIEQNKQNAYLDKKGYNDINSINCNKLNEECISEDKLKLNIKNAKEYSEEILQNLIEEEKKNRNKINPNYFNHQSEITPYMRSILIDWLIEIIRIFKFKEETLYTTMYIIDAYLSKKYIAKNKFQLLGITSLFIASKLNDIMIRRISDYSDITNKTYSVYEIKIMEIDILKTLNFELLIPSSLSFYEIISQKVGISNDINKYKFGEFLMQSFLINNQSLNYTFSTIACATCYIIMKFCKMENYRIIFENNFCNITKSISDDNIGSIFIKEYIIKDCAKKMCETINIIINSNLKSTINKFSDNTFYNIIKNNM
jgi:hypothetical protein